MRTAPPLKTSQPNTRFILQPNTAFYCLKPFGCRSRRLPLKQQFTALTLKDVDDHEKNSSKLDVGGTRRCVVCVMCVMC